MRKWWEVIEGDCREVMAGLEPECVDATVCDPPYELGFMGKGWDSAGVSFEAATWRAAWRVLKPGGHLLAFGGTRTYHRIAVAIEDAGFEIRDCLSWLYGSGFPKSLDVSKAIDKMAPRAGMFDAFAAHYADRRRVCGLTHAAICEAGKFYDNYNHGGASVNWERGHNVPTLAQWAVLQPLLGLSGEWLPLIERIEAEREVIAERKGSARPGFSGDRYGDVIEAEFADTAPATPEAEQWAGWGTALKPAWEPVIVARKPLIGTVAANVLQHGTGALNVDACRIGTGQTITRVSGGKGFGVNFRDDNWNPPNDSYSTVNPEGRWPANVALDEAAAEMLDAQADTSRFYYVAKASRRERNAGLEGMPERDTQRCGSIRTDRGAGYDADSKHINHHPTVKPIALMRWLVRLVTAPGGLVLDPFNGSGSTGIAAVLEGFRYIGIEQSPEYAEIARRRIAHHEAEHLAEIEEAANTPAQLALNVA